MIEPEEIDRKAQKLYPEFLCAWLDGEEFFPRNIPSNKTLDAKDHSGSAAILHRLRDGSKEVRGYCYSIEWRERNSKAFGRNPFPERFYFETQDDYLKLIGKQAEFWAFTKAVERLREEFPELNPWIRANRRTLIDAASSIEGLLHVLRYFRENPRPNRFARELPIPVDTKFIERHEPILRDWLDLVVTESVHSHETHFARRYGLRYREQHVPIRFLDPKLQLDAGSTWSELSLPISALAAMPIRSPKIIIVENLVNLLTLPFGHWQLGLGALGRAASELRQVNWLHSATITYWGDLDVEGFEILSSLRAAFPHVQSWLMDEAALNQYRTLAATGTGRKPVPPPFLTLAERAAFDRCVEENLRIEQERIPHLELINTIGGGDP